MATWAKGIDFKNSGNTKRIGGIGVYGTDTTSEKIYIGLGAEPWSNAGLQLTNSAINFKGNKIYHAGDKPTASEIGAASSSHTHNSLNRYYSSRVTSADITVIGDGRMLKFEATSSMTTSKPKNDGHIIHLEWDNTGGYSSQIYVGNNKDAHMQYRGMSSGTWGSWHTVYSTNNKPTPADIGAAASSHTHSYIPLSGSTGITGVLRSNSEIQTTSQNAFRAVSGNYGFFIRNDGSNTYFLLTNSGDQYGNWNSLRPLSVNNATGVVTFGNGLKGTLDGNASTSTKLQTARTIALGGDASGSATFDGSANATISATVRKTCFVGSDVDGTSGWYKVASQTMSGYGNTNITFAVTSTYGYYNSGILQLQMRSDDTSISCKRLAWHSRMGLSPSHYIINVNGMTWTLYAYQPNSRYGRLMFEVLSQSSINNKNSGFTLYNSSTKESANPKATVTSSDGATVGYANSLASTRTLTIGNSGKSFNGTANVSWSLSEIGAAPTSHNHTSLSSVSNISLTSGLKIKPGGDRGVSFETTEGKSITLSAHGDFTGLRYITADTINDYNIGAVPTRNKMCIPVIGSDSVMEIGRYIDFHTDESSTDYHLRIEGGSENLKLNFRQNAGWLGFYRPDGNRWGYVGCGSTANSNFIVNADIGHLTLHASATGGAISFYPQSKYVYTDANSVPDKDNTYYLGTTSPARRWKQLCAVTASIATSDSNYKTKIEPIINEDEPMVISNLKNVHNPKAFSQTINTEKATKSDYYEFIRDRFKPYSYEYIINDINGCEDEFSEEDKLKCAKSIGFVADEYDLENDKVAREFIFETSDGILNYNTGNYITVIAIALKESINKIEILEYENQQLKEKLSAIEQKLGLE